jgi:hypothetical protein
VKTTGTRTARMSAAAAKLRGPRAAGVRGPGLGASAVIEAGR